MKERGRDKKRAAWSPCGVGIDEISAAVLRALAINFIGLVALFCEEVEGKRRGERGLFIGVAGASY
jgi:hypothetical protein